MKPRTYTFFSAKNISDKYLSDIIALRKSHFYESMFDVRYWNGGVYNEMDIEVMKKKTDESSKYALLLDENDSVVAYARYSTAYKKKNDYTVAKLHIILSAKDIMGKLINIKAAEKTVTEKASDFLLSYITEDCTKQDASLLISEICIYPYPNIPSLQFHRKHGYMCIQKPLETLSSQNGDMIFTTLGKSLNNAPVRTF